MDRNIGKLLSSVALPCLMMVEGSIAQEADQDNADVDVITVTARLRSESLQEVPESITALSAGQIERAGITNLRGVADLTPNFSQLENFRPGLARIQIRGLVTPQVGDPPVAFVVDGVTASDLEFMNQDLFDIERIEVLRGAQGALYGRGAIGGAINITTKKPTDEIEGSVAASYGNGNNMKFSGFVSGPVVEEKVHFRVGGYYRNFDGLINDAFLNEKVDSNEEVSAFGMLSFNLGENTYLDLRGRYTTTEAGLGYYQNVSEGSVEDFSILSSQNVLGVDNRDLGEFSAKLEHDFDGATFTLIGAYSYSDQSALSDGDYSAVPSDFVFHFAGAQENILDVKSFTVESRLTSTDDGPFRWSVGSFFQNRERNSAFTSYDDAVGDARVEASAFTSDTAVFSILDENKSKAWGLSAQVNYDITDQLEVTAAARFDQDKRESVDARDIAGTFAADTFKQFQPKVSISYQATDDFLVYAGYSRGFRSGGFNEPSPLINRVFDKEVSDSFELGFKSSFADGMTTLNGSVFRINQKDAQITRFNIDSFTLENISVDEAHSQGFELELSFKPTDELSFFINGGVIDSKIDAFAERPDLIG
ncbi:MAG: TonB-dependent receptor, partial [Emcibacteraceae bacterium]|nr:TonB-dependent receptor [Emcibacteraceae bacterium]